jgi:predicted transcriptional regulator of viral defense system
MTAAESHAIQKIKELGGTFRSSELLQQGVSPRTLYALRNSGLLEQLSRGTYRLVEQGALSNPDLVTVALRIPQGVICLVSALSFHGLTTQIPHAVSIAITKTMRNPAISYPPLNVYRYDERSYQTGIEKHLIDGVSVSIYNPEKTLADCFKFRNKIGMDLVLEAIKQYRAQHSLNIAELMKYAEICRVANIMRPYLESLL